MRSEKLLSAGTAGPRVRATSLLLYSGGPRLSTRTPFKGGAQSSGRWPAQRLFPRLGASVPERLSPYYCLERVRWLRSSSHACLAGAARAEGPRRLVGRDDNAYGLAVSSDGKMLASASAGETLKLWDVAPGKVTQTFGRHGTSVYCAAFAPDGKALAL